MEERPGLVYGTTTKVATGCGSMYVTINQVDGHPFEVFIRMGKAGNCTMSNMESFAVAVSIALREHPETSAHLLKSIAKRLIGVRCDKPISKIEGKGVECLSCADGIGQTFMIFLRALEKSRAATPSPDVCDQEMVCD